MHTLTKIFIVLQALLSVFILALAVPLAVNQDHWKKEAQTQEGAAVQARASLQLAQTKHAAEAAFYQLAITKLNNEKTDLVQQLNTKDQQLIDLHARLGDAKIASSEVRSQIDTLTATTKTQSQIIENQGTEITTRRNESLDTQKRSIELEDRLRDTLNQRDVAVQATKILQEQLVQAKEAKKPVDGTSMPEDYLASPLVRGHVLQVVNTVTGDRNAVIDLGSRDGLSRKMRFYLARGKDFMGYLTITEVDINRAVGDIELEQGDGVRVSDEVLGGVN